ncbi:hypothetical protein [Dactylosporangium sp. NPDC000521]|uniref:hypothetical protein n=1 Tax=Dactylosporangium sp. NPDC000521 TaxID=3363975 RepID=UPI0036C2CD2B
MRDLIIGLVIGGVLGAYAMIWMHNVRLQRTLAPLPAGPNLRGEPETITAELSAQHLVAQPVQDDDGVVSLELADGETVVQINHEVGDGEVAAGAIDQAAAVMRYHAEQIRRHARREIAWT